MLLRYSILASIAIPPSIGIELRQVSRYFDISSIEPALAVGVQNIDVTVLHFFVSSYVSIALTWEWLFRDIHVQCDIIDLVLSCNIDMSVKLSWP